MYWQLILLLILTCSNENALKRIQDPGIWRNFKQKSGSFNCIECRLLQFIILLYLGYFCASNTSYFQEKYALLVAGGEK